MGQDYRLDPFSRISLKLAVKELIRLQEAIAIKADRITAYYCEPFMVSGLLPTLGPAIIKQALNAVGVSGKIFYPALRFFIEDCRGGSPSLMRLADDIPLQITDYFFLDDSVATHFLSELPKEYREPACFLELKHLRQKALHQVEKVIEAIKAERPDIFCFSVTFGSAFAEYLIPRIREASEKTVIIVGGSCCTPEYAKQLLSKLPEIDFILCDESTDSLIQTVRSLFFGQGDIPTCVCFKGHETAAFHALTSLDGIPMPDFDDYIEVIDAFHIPRTQVTLPYEMSRGCWWCQRKPCNMCGFFGVRKQYIMKSPEKTVSELRILSQKYGVNKFRFSDLVQPVGPALEALSDLATLNLRLFWELRPDISYIDLGRLREQGMSYAQIGLESLSTPALIHMNKGTDAVHNLAILIQAQTLKIDLVWNYLYGLPGDQTEWYRSVIAIIPLLYHLQPPIPRRCWSNKYSEWYDTGAGDKAIARYAEREEELEAAYHELLAAIEVWRSAFRREYRLCVDRSFRDGFRVIRAFGEMEVFDLPEPAASLYCFFFEPHTEDEAQALGLTPKAISNMIDRFMADRILVKIDGKYLALASDSSRYKWTKSREQVLHFLLPNEGK